MPSFSSPAAPFDLVIWDCDGCLIDSEYLACGAAAEGLGQAGYPISTEDFIHRFAGSGWPEIKARLHQERGAAFVEAIPLDWIGARQDRLFDEQLQAIPHVAAAIKAMDLPVCVASGSGMDRLEHTLKKTGLWDRFAGHVYSASMVAHGKPAPDLFLYAAAQMGVDPARCLVIEDGMPGIQGAKAAGMTVFGFLGGSHISPAWRERMKVASPDVIFDDMRDLPEMVATYPVQK